MIILYLTNTTQNDWKNIYLFFW